jgi:hypothetical protein
VIEASKDVVHAVGFLQTAYTILLALALGEAFKQFIVDGTEKAVQWNRLPALLSFLFLIFPFFHGMSRYFFVTYLRPSTVPQSYAGFLMFDGIIFMCLSAFFFAMSRSLASSQWQRYYCFLLSLLLVDSIWIFVVLWRGIAVKPWLILNFILATVLITVLALYKSRSDSLRPPIVCAFAILLTTTISYLAMRDFYFP